VIASFALLAAGCAGGDAGPDREEYVARGNEICRALDREFRQLGPPPAQGTPNSAVWELRVQQLAQRAYGRLEALEPPDELRDEREGFVRAIALNRRHIRRMRIVAEANERELDAGIADGPAQREFLDLTAEIERDSARVQEHFRAIGWNACAELSD
jgi:hypothetical protein